MAERRSAGSWFFLNAIPATVVMVLLLGTLWVLEAVDYAMQKTGDTLDTGGISARDVSDLPDIYTAPFLHGDFEHLAGNSLPLLVLGFLVALRGVFRWAGITLVIATVSGLGIWVTAPPNSVTLGASGLIFGYLAFLLVRGLFDRRLLDIAIGVAVFALYGSLLWGVLPQQQGISWQGHLFGAVGGVLAAFVFRKRRSADRADEAPPAAPGAYGY